MAANSKMLSGKLGKTNSKLRRFLLWTLFIVTSIVIVMFNYWQAQVSIQVGDVAAEDIFYEKNTTSYYSAIRTQEAKNEAAASVAPVYRIDNTALNSTIKQLEKTFSDFEGFMLFSNPEVDRLEEPEQVTGEEEGGADADEDENESSEGDEEKETDENPDEDEKPADTDPVLPQAPELTYADLVDDAMTFFGFDMLAESSQAEKREMLESVLAISRNEYISVKKQLENTISGVIQPGVTEDELLSAKALIESNIQKASLPETTIDFMLELYGRCTLQANKFYDAVSTAAEVEAAQDAIQPVNVTVMKGERIISRGTVVSDLHIEALKALGLLKDQVRLLPYIGLMAMIVIFYYLLIRYIRSYYPKSRMKEGNIVLMGLVINFMLFLAKAFSMIDIPDVELLGQFGFLLPVAAGSMILAILIGQGVAIIYSLFISVVAGLLFDGGIYCTAVAMVGSVTGVICSRGISQRGQFVSSSLYIAAANILAIAALDLLTEQSYRILAIGAGFGFINGLVSAILAMGLLPFLESGFKITTSARLTELSNSNHPLLKRLMLEAPGTYHHSVMVGNLAETAADAIGADPLLVRVCAYYHDVGKLKRPYFFVENQQPGDNPHDKLQPSLSAMIITSHVKDGVELLREYRFPKEVVDAALSHHGTGLLSFFYHKALEQAADSSSVRKEDFMYRGKLPDTKELALVSLADSVQAAVKALNTNDLDAIEQRVRSVIKTRIDEGQLAAAPLTFADIELIIQNFMRVLSGMTHSRIEYPEQVARELAEKEMKYNALESARDNADTQVAGRQN